MISVEISLAFQMTQLLHAKRVEVIFAFSLFLSLFLSLSHRLSPKHTHTHTHTKTRVCVFLFNGPVCCTLNRCHGARPAAEGVHEESLMAESVRAWGRDRTGTTLIIRYFEK